MARPTSDVQQILQRLRATPEHFAAAAQGLTDAQLRSHPDEGSWSVHELLAHLRGAADVQGGWMTRMLEEDTPSIRYVSARTGMRKTGYESVEFAPFLQAFTQARSALVERLASLTTAAWARSATFRGTTPGWAPTVLDLGRGIGGHEASHFAQITAAADVHRRD